MNIKAFFTCGGGSNLILGTDSENQIFFLRNTVKFIFFLPNCQKIMSHPLFLRVRITHTNDKAVIYNYRLYYIQEIYTL